MAAVGRGLEAVARLNGLVPYGVPNSSIVARGRDARGGRCPRLVVLRALGLGDFLTAVPAMRALAAAFPGHRRLLAAPRALAPLAALVDLGGRGGEAGAAAIQEVVHTGELAPLPAALHGADLAVNLHGCGPQSHRLIVETRPRSMLGFRNDAVPESSGGPEWMDHEHEVARWCRLLAESGIAADPEALEIAVPPGGPDPRAAGATLLHPGAASAARRWPGDRFAAVAARERELGRRVVVTGSPAERELALDVARRAGLPAEAVLAGKTDLAGLARLVASADRVVSGDTGVGHLATALATPSVLLFGPTSPDRWGPPPGRPRHRVLWAGAAGDPHADRPSPGLLEIGPADVAAALDGLPERELGPTAA